METLNLEGLTKREVELLLEAKKVLENAYNPYSKFSVGAALLSSADEIISGANVENAAYGSCICAERSALVRANAMGIRQFHQVAIIVRGENGSTLEVTAPCGACRQMLYEASQVSGVDLKIIMSNTDMTKIVKANISELLPLAFGPVDLGIDISKFKSLSF